MAIHSSILAWRTPWTEEPGGLQSIGLQRPRHNWSDWASKLSSCSWHWASHKTWERYHLPPPSTVLYSVPVSSAQSTFPDFLFKMFCVWFFFHILFVDELTVVFYPTRGTSVTYLSHFRISNVLLQSSNWCLQAGLLCVKDKPFSKKTTSTPYFWLKLMVD